MLDPVQRAALPEAAVGPLITTLNGALNGVFAVAVGVAVLAMGAALIVPPRAARA